MAEADSSSAIAAAREDDDAEALRSSYKLCRQMHAKGNRTTFLATRLLAPKAIRPHADALHAYFLAADIVADEGGREDRERDFARWSADVLAELHDGRSEHPLRRALVHTARAYSLEPELFERFHDATAADSTRTADFETFDELRAFLSGVSGTAAVLTVRILGPATPQTDRVASLMGEVHQLIDIFEDFPIDLPRQRLYLPLEDLARCGVRRSDLIGEGAESAKSPARAVDVTSALDALIRLQVTRARAMLSEAGALVESLPPAARTIISASIDLQAAQLDAVERSGARVLHDGMSLPRARVLRLTLPYLRVVRGSG